jgi:hypothetical protein
MYVGRTVGCVPCGACQEPDRSGPIPVPLTPPPNPQLDAERPCNAIKQPNDAVHPQMSSHAGVYGVCTRNCLLWKPTWSLQTSAALARSGRAWVSIELKAPVNVTKNHETKLLAGRCANAPRLTVTMPLSWCSLARGKTRLSTHL